MLGKQHRGRRGCSEWAGKSNRWDTMETRRGYVIKIWPLILIGEEPLEGLDQKTNIFPLHL